MDLSVLKRVFYGWWVLLACLILHAISAGTFFYGFSVFYTPILMEFGWSSAVTAGAFSLSRLEGGLEGPLVGWLVDRYGGRKLLFFGVVATAIGYLAMIYVDSVFLLYLVYGGLLSIGFNTGFMHSLTAIITNWFIRMRSRAMSIYAVSAGIGGALLVPLLARFTTGFGWRVTAIFCGLIYLVIGLPLSLVIKDKPEDMELLPDGASTKLSEGTDSERKVQIPPEGTGDETKFSAGATLRSRTFWTLVLAESFRSFLLGSVVLHQIPYLVSIGVTQDTAANILGLMIAMSIPGRLFFGSLGDFYSKRKLLVIVMALQALGIFAFSQAQGVMHAYAFVAIYGVSYGGGIPLTYAFRGELFGRRRYAIISGLIAPFKMIGSVVGPIFAGYIYDVYQDYSLAFTVFTLLAVLSSMTFIFVKPDRLFARTLQG